MVLRPWSPARGHRPSGPFVVNQGSPQASGLLGFWPLGDVGFARDYAMYGHGTLVNGPKPIGATGQVDGQALLFVSASTQYVTIAHRITVPAAFSVSAWVFRNTDRQYDGAFAKTNVNNPAPFDIYSNNGVWNVFVGDGSTVFANPTAASVAGVGKWEHLAVTCTGAGASNTVTLYLQGVSAASAASPVAVADTGAVMTIGTRNDTVTLMDGRIAHVCLWNRALTAAEVWALYNASTRWDLYWVPSSRTFFDAAPGSPPQIAYPISDISAGSWTGWVA